MANKKEIFEQLEELWESFQKEHNGTTKESEGLSPIPAPAKRI